MWCLQVTCEESDASEGAGALSVGATELDVFTLRLGVEDARLLADLLKLAVAERAGDGAAYTLATLLTALANALPQVGRGTGTGGL